MRRFGGCTAWVTEVGFEIGAVPGRWRTGSYYGLIYIVGLSESSLSEDSLTNLLAR